MGTLSRDQILGADDRKTDELEVPEWGGSVKIRSMSGSEVQKYVEAVQADEDADIKHMCLLIHFSVVGDDGKKLFSTEDIEALADKNLLVLRSVSEACIAVNGLNQAEVADELKKTASE